VLGDWAAVILKAPDRTSFALPHLSPPTWLPSSRLSYVYGSRSSSARESSDNHQHGLSSLTSNFDTGSPRSDDYHAVQMKLSSLLVLPLRTRRENARRARHRREQPFPADDGREAPLAEILAERAALQSRTRPSTPNRSKRGERSRTSRGLKDEFLRLHRTSSAHVTSIKGYTQLAKSLIHENDLSTSEEYLNVALDQIDRMSRLILELLDVVPHRDGPSRDPPRSDPLARLRARRRAASQRRS